MKCFYLGLMLFSMQFLFSQKQKDEIYRLKISDPDTEMIPIDAEKYKVFTQKKGSGKIKLLLLHGGPENTHEYFENFPEELKQSGVTVYFYDQLGSYFSDTPDDASIWNIERFVEEVEQVRKALKLEGFYLLGHSWGGMLAELYAAKYPKHIKGLILSNVPGFFAKDSGKLKNIIDSISNDAFKRAAQLPKFARHKAQIDSLERKLKIVDQDLSKELAAQLSRTSDSLFGRTMYYRKPGKIPDPLKRSMTHTRFESIEKYHFNPFGADYAKALRSITMPALIIGSKNDFVRPDLYWQLKSIMLKSKVRIEICPNGAHFPMWDDTANYFRALNLFLSDVEKGKF